FREDLVVVGGWVPELLFPRQGHMGSLDVDFAVKPTALANNAYETILRRLLSAGYSHHNAHTHFLKAVSGVADPIKVDFISGQYGKGEKSAFVQVKATTQQLAGRRSGL